jgi:2-alkyl-3-oxoalkanoate reductase
MRVFITGATGVIGRRVLPLLLERGHEVTVLARRGSGSAHRDLVRQGAVVVEASLFDPPALSVAVAAHDVVINLATHMPPSSVRMFMPGAWRENDRIRRDGSANLVNAALGASVQRVIQESYAPIYASHGSAWIDENEPVHPGRYNRTILDAEGAVRRFADAGRAGVVLRFAAFYGPDAGQLKDMLRAIRRGWAPLPGAPDSYVSTVSHDDAAAAVIAALELPSGVYNVVDDWPVSHREFVDALADAAGVAHPRLLPAWTAKLGGSVARALTRSLRISNRKLRDASGWAPRYRSVREGFPAALAASGPGPVA